MQTNGFQTMSFATQSAGHPHFSCRGLLPHPGMLNPNPGMPLPGLPGPGPMGEPGIPPGLPGGPRRW